LYLLEYMARTGNSPAQLVQHLADQTGPHYFRRRDVAFAAQAREKIRQKLTSSQWTSLAGLPVRKSDSIDGRRLTFDHGWLAVRFSGTEPLLRIYCEADSPQRMEQLLGAAAEYLGV